jgi:uncharacterized membrane protein YfcA
MLSYIVVGTASVVTAGLTLYSGFGLGTLLMPVFAIFFPIEVAIAGTAIVHFANNIFKIALVGGHAEKALVLRFGVPALMAALLGAFVLGSVSDFGEIARYQIGSRTAVITPIKLAMGILMLLFALLELLPSLRDVTFDRRYLVLGGLVSGFFGGLSGHQGALRSAFLVKAGVSTEAFVGTNAVIGFMVDAARITAYTVMLVFVKTSSPISANEWPLIATGIVAAFLGIMIGKKFLHKVTMAAVRAFTGVLLFGIAIALGSGII